MSRSYSGLQPSPETAWCESPEAPSSDPLAEVEKRMQDAALAVSGDLTSEMAVEHLSTGGKRFRARLVIDAAGGRGARDVRLARCAGGAAGEGLGTALAHLAFVLGEHSLADLAQELDVVHRELRGDVEVDAGRLEGGAKAEHEVALVGVELVAELIERGLQIVAGDRAEVHVRHRLFGEAGQHRPADFGIIGGSGLVGHRRSRGRWRLGAARENGMSSAVERCRAKDRT